MVYLEVFDLGGHGVNLIVEFALPEADVIHALTWGVTSYLDLVHVLTGASGGDTL